MVDSKNDNKNEAPKMSFDLNMHTARLLMDEPFFAAISRRVDKRASTSLPTAGVLINRDSAQFEMLYNPKFFAGLTDEQRTDVLKHEFYHILFLHVTSRMPEGVDVKLWNVATDLAINSHLYNLPEGGLIPGKEGTPFEDLPRGESAEWYLATCLTSRVSLDHQERARMAIRAAMIMEKGLVKGLVENRAETAILELLTVFLIQWMTIVAGLTMAVKKIRS